MRQKMTKTKNQYYYSEQTPLCHSELVSESITTSAWRVGANLNGSCQRANGFRTKSGMTTEGGRSMVEMLGVLAIIGVLSVGGIAGYTMAMNKYRASEILNGASMRAMVVATQIQMKPSLTNPNLGEFTGDTPAGVSITALSRQATDKQFKLKLETVDPAVCDQMKNTVGDNGLIRDWGTNCAELTFNNDLTATDPAPADPCAGLDCGSGTCVNGECIYCTTDEDCYKNSTRICPPTGNECSVGGAISLCDLTWCTNSCDIDVTSTCVSGKCNCVYTCFTSDTPIMLANGTCKRADQITYEDELLVWNFDEGKFDKAKPLWIKVPEVTTKYNYLRFSDGSVLKTISQHRIFNREAGKFTYPMTEDTPLGTHTLNAKGEWVTLVEKKVVEEEVVFYNIITYYHMNCFAGNVLTSCRFSNLYPIKDMKYVKDNRPLVPYSEYAVLEKKWYDGLRLAEQPLDVNRGNDVHHGASVIEHIQRVYIDKAQ